MARILASGIGYSLRTCTVAADPMLPLALTTGTAMTLAVALAPSGFVHLGPDTGFAFCFNIQTYSQ